MQTKNLLLLALVALLTLLPLWVNGDAEFSGADGQAEEIIKQTRPGYEPWFSFPWEPPSGEIESLLFALQAAAGAGFLGYFLGYQRGKNASSQTRNYSRQP